VRGDGKFYAKFLIQISDNKTAIEVFILINPKGNIPISIVNSTIEK